jgi:hypothetical protein
MLKVVLNLKCLHRNDLDIVLREMRDLTYALQELEQD